MSGTADVLSLVGKAIEQCSRWHRGEHFHLPEGPYREQLMAPECGVVLPRLTRCRLSTGSWRMIGKRSGWQRSS